MTTTTLHYENDGPRCGKNGETTTKEPVLACERPAKTGPNAGNPVKGTRAGLWRHKRAGEAPCPECVAGDERERREYYEANRERYAEQSRAWALAHPERSLEIGQRYREANPEKARAATRKWYAANRESARQAARARYPEIRDAERERNRRYRQANAARVAAKARAYKLANPEKIRAIGHRRRARLAKATVVPFTEAQLDQRMSMWGYRCWMCGGPFEQIDHVKPLAKDGAHCLSNLRPACRSCNSRKKDRWPIEGVLHAK